MKNEENNNMTDPEEIEEASCDAASKPPSTPIPAGYSNLSYPKCNTATKTWYWYDPTVA